MRVELFVDPESRAADVVRALRPVTHEPVAALVAATRAGASVFRAQLNKRDHDEVEAALRAAISSLEFAQLAFSVALDGRAVDLSVLHNVLRSSAQTRREQLLMGHLEAPDTSMVERIILHLEIRLGSSAKAKALIGLVLLLIATTVGYIVFR